MDSAQLEAFVAVCKVLNFTKASAHLHISQSAVTARIKSLESSVGKALFERDNRNVSLTQAGLAFLPYAERMLRLYEESKLTLSEQFESHLVMSGPGSIWHYRYLPHILAFRRNHAKVALKLLSNIDPSYMIRDLLLDGEVHVSVRFDPPDHPKVAKKLLFEDEILLVSASPREAEITKADFANQQYCHIEWGSPFPEWFTGIVGPGYVPPLHIDHSAIMLTLLLQGEGYGFLPRSIAQPYLDQQSLYQLACEFDLPYCKVYALYLAENHDHPNIKLGLELLGIS